MSELNECLVLQTPGAMVGGTSKKLNNFVGIVTDMKEKPIINLHFLTNMVI